VIIESLSDLRPGDVGFGPIGGAAGVGVGAGQCVLGDWSLEDWVVRHVYMVTRAASQPLPGEHYPPMCVEAMPGGVRCAKIGDRWGPKYRYIRPAYSEAWQAEAAAQHAEQMLNVPYNWLNYPALSAKHLHLPVPHLNRFISRVDERGYPKHVICSQHVDAALTLASFQVFDDGRLPQDVWPSALHRQLLNLGPAAVSRSVWDAESS
jgi:hypothetical protein